ncbi:hypothetical protein ZWY2020_010460 [Hordeum vulgare]|nr:hypothetical protein ZWY2020_010460 [Hordeum vulgare]
MANGEASDDNGRAVEVAGGEDTFPTVHRSIVDGVWPPPGNGGDPLKRPRLSREVASLLRTPRTRRDELRMGRCVRHRAATSPPAPSSSFTGLHRLRHRPGHRQDAYPTFPFHSLRLPA